MKIYTAGLYKKMLVGIVSVIITSTGLTKFVTTAKSVEASTPCIITISGIQYDVAPLTVAGVHPGGNVFVCGTDMTALFMAMPTHAADIARMTPYIYHAPTATPIPTIAPTVAPTATPRPDPSISPSPVPSVTPVPSISPAPHHEENESEEVLELKESRHEERASNHGQEVRTVARSNKTGHDKE